MSKMMRLLFIAATMSAFLVGMIADHQIRRTNGTEILLDLEPVDPRDLLAGYYVIIRTPVHQLEPQGLDGNDTFERNQDIYVVIEPDENGSWQPIAIFAERPDDGVFLHGKVQYATLETARVNFNLERFYADENTAQELETRRRDNSDSMRLIVSVGSDGRAIIRGLEIDGERHIAPLL